MTGRQLLRRWLVTALVVCGFAFCALGFVSAVGVETGVPGGLVGLLLALIPVGIVVPAFLWLDRFEAEPVPLLAFAFGWGALVASSVALVLNTGSFVLLGQLVEEPTQVIPVVVAPIVEETAKGLGVLAVVLFRGREFDGVVDGIVYAGIVAAGFAFAENILYLGRALNEGSDSLAFVFFLRGVVAPFAHPLFTLFIGLGLGIAATTRSATRRVLAPLCGLVVAVVLHALWNLSTVTGLSGFFSLYVLLQLPVFAGAVAVAVWARRREGHLIAVHLTPYADAGWLSGAEMDMLESMAARRRARVWAKATGGRPALEAMRSFQDAGSELALLQMRRLRGAAGDDAKQTEHELLGTMVTQRARLGGFLATVPAARRA